VLVQTPIVDTEVQIRDRIAAMLGEVQSLVPEFHQALLERNSKVGVANLFIGSWIETTTPISSPAAKEVLAWMFSNLAIDPVIFRACKTQLNSQAAFIERT
jgi:hypothetical protein